MINHKELKKSCFLSLWPWFCLFWNVLNKPGNIRKNSIFKNVKIWIYITYPGDWKTLYSIFYHQHNQL